MTKKTNPTNNDKKICFVSLGAYPLLSGKNPENVIGPDVHHVILANELIKHNFKIVFITQDENESRVENINGL